VQRMHYSGSYVAASRRYGMFIDTPHGPDLIGVAVFAVPAQARVLTNPFPDLAPSLNQFVGSTYWSRSGGSLPVAHRASTGMDPLAGADPVIAGGIAAAGRRPTARVTTYIHRRAYIGRSVARRSGAG